MAQHFLLSRAAKTLSLAHVFTMKDAEAEMTFRRIRWADTDGEPVCPHCGGVDAYDCRRLKGAPRFRCRACERISRSRPGRCSPRTSCRSRCYLAAIAIFCNEVKGKSALALSAISGVSYKCAFVLAHKLREAMAAELKGRMIGGDGKSAEVDAGYFGGYVKPANLAEKRRDRRFAAQPIRQAQGRGHDPRARRQFAPGRVPHRRPGASMFMRARIAKGTIVNADEVGAWNDLHARFEMKRINHEEAYSLDGACTNWAEEFFSRMRRAEIGHHHHIAGPYLLRYAQEASWREDNRRVSNGDQVNRVAGLAMKSKPSVDFSGYWQRHTEQANQLFRMSAEVGLTTLANYQWAPGLTGMKVTSKRSGWHMPIRESGAAFGELRRRKWKPKARWSRLWWP